MNSVQRHLSLNFKGLQNRRRNTLRSTEARSIAFAYSFEKSEPRSRHFIFTFSAFLLRAYCRSEDRMLFRDAWDMLFSPPPYNSPIRSIHPA